MVRVGLLGCGTVGSGVVKLLEQNHELISRRSGCPIALKKVLERDAARCLALGLPLNMVAGSLDEIVTRATPFKGIFWFIVKTVPLLSAMQFNTPDSIPDKCFKVRLIVRIFMFSASKKEYIPSRYL